MSKTIPIALAPHYALGSTTLAHALKITRTDGEVFAFTSADSDDPLSGVVHSSAPGLNTSGIATTAGLAVDNLELSTLHDGTVFQQSDVLGGRWRNAALEISEYNYNAPADGVNPILWGTLGEVQIQRGIVVVELRSIKQKFQQPIGIVTSKTCRARLGDALCTVDLNLFSDANFITSVTSNQVFAGSTADVNIPGDADYASVVTLVGGASGPTDTSTLARTITTVGNAVVDATQMLFGNNTMKFDGSGDRFTMPYTAAADLGTSDFTVEFFFYHNANPNDGLFHVYFCSSGTATLNSGICVFKDWTGGLQIQVGNITTMGPYAVSSGAWAHFAITRSGNTFRAFLGGVLQATFTGAGSCSGSDGLTLGGGGQSGTFGSNSLNGHLSQVRCTKGVARYTAAFTPPAAAFYANAPLVQSRTYPVDWFAEGELTFTSGNCNGLSQKIKSSAVDGTITLSLPMWQTLAVSDTYIAVAGCRKRHERTLANPSGVSDCLDKFDNVLNFQGERLLPGLDQLTRPPE